MTLIDVLDKGYIRAVIHMGNAILDTMKTLFPVTAGEWFSFETRINGFAVLWDARLPLKYKHLYVKHIKSYILEKTGSG